MTANYQTQKDIGDKSEVAVLEELVSRYGYRVLFRADSEENFPYFDSVVMNKAGFISSVEIKADTVNNYNAAIEYKQSGLDSALLLSTAKVYIIHKTSSQKMYWIYTHKLKEYIRVNKLGGVACNDGTSECYLVPLSIFHKL